LLGLKFSSTPAWNHIESRVLSPDMPSPITRSTEDFHSDHSSRSSVIGDSLHSSPSGSPYGSNQALTRVTGIFFELHVPSSEFLFQCFLNSLIFIFNDAVDVFLSKCTLNINQMGCLMEVMKPSTDRLGSLSNGWR
jgi:hypothetical protein